MVDTLENPLSERIPHHCSVNPSGEVMILKIFAQARDNYPIGIIARVVNPSLPNQSADIGVMLADLDTPDESTHDGIL